MFSYLLQGLSFIRLRRHFPNIERPYRSPFGMMGAALTVIIALVTIGFQLRDPVYGAGVIGVAIWYALAILYFAVYGRNTLVLSPEEEFAVQHRESSWHHPSDRGPHVARASQGEKAKADVAKER
jgi:ethanolamine permease